MIEVQPKNHRAALLTPLPPHPAFAGSIPNPETVLYWKTVIEGTKVTPLQVWELDLALTALRQHVLRAMDTHPPYASTHDAIGVGQEEMDELWEAVRHHHPAAFVSEAKDLAAVCVRIMMEVPTWKGGTRKPV